MYGVEINPSAHKELKKLISSNNEVLFLITNQIKVLTSPARSFNSY